MRRLTRCALVAPLVALGLALACDPPRERPNVLFVSIDTLRADHLGLYGWKRPTSPCLDRFAETAVVFEQADSASSWTLPSLASLMTSLTTSTHGCWKIESRLDPSFRTLAEHLRDAGYDTAIVASHLFLSASHGLQQGFTHVDTRIVQEEMDVTSEAVSDQGIRWLERKAAAPDGSPWMMWLHYFDPHAPYLPHAGVSEAFGTKTDLDLYDGEIAHTDRHVGRLLDALERTGLSARTIVVVVADHGEEFNEHGNRGHGYTLYEEVVRVPLLVRVPGLAPRRVADVVPTVDVMPTLLELCGAAPRNEIEGQSLLPLMRGEESPRRDAIAEVRWQAKQDMKSLRRGAWKYVEHGLDTDRFDMLFELSADPGEECDVFARHLALDLDLRAELDRRLAHARRLSAAYGRASSLTLSPAEIERLRGLGYVGNDGGR